MPKTLIRCIVVSQPAGFICDFQGSCLSQHLGLFCASCRQRSQLELVIRLRTVDLLTAGTMM